MLSILSTNPTGPWLSALLRALPLTTAINCSMLLLAGGCAMIHPAPDNDAAASAGNSDNLGQRKSARSDIAANPNSPDSNEQASQSITEPQTANQSAAKAASVDQQQLTIVQPQQEPPQQQETAKPPQQPVGNLLQRLRTGFSFPDCSRDAQAKIWQSWYRNHPDYLQRVFRRAEPWLYLVMAETSKRELPLEFALLPVIESAYDVFALSPAGAHGAWQMTLPTAQDYRLRVAPEFDARRDMVLATTAALTMLDRLMHDFADNWRLALAAYNAGPARVARAARRAGGKLSELDPARLALPRETKTFAPKLHGLVCLLRTQFDKLSLPEIADKPVLSSMTFEQQIDLVTVAQQAEMDIAALYTLNAGLSSHLSPASGYTLKLPQRHLSIYQSAMSAGAELSGKPPSAMPAAQTAAPVQVTVKRGDTLGAIARRHNSSVPKLQQINGLSGHLIRPGQKLLLAPAATDVIAASHDAAYTRQLAKLQQLQRSLPGVNNLRHRIRRHETLSTIAQRYDVSVAQLQGWNNIRNAHRIRAGQTLRVYHAQAVQPHEDKNYRVRSGDSLWTIARRFRLSLDDLMHWNELSAGSILRPGQLLRLAP